MAQAKNIIVGGLAIVGGVTLAKDAAAMAAARTINNITYILGNPTVNLSDVGHGNIGIKLPVTIMNANEFSITIDKFLGQISYGDIPIGSVLIPDSFTLISGETIGIDLIFTVNFPALIQDVFSAAQTGGFSIILEKLYLKGSLFVLGTSFSNSIELPIDKAIPIIPGL